MLKYTVLFLFAFLATASITNPTLVKNLFSRGPGDEISYQLFNTRAGIIAYSVENYYNAFHGPQYALINLQSNSTTVILTDIINACNQGPSAFSRLHYHVQTSSLVYYCTSNNSLLILDEEGFTVQRTVSTDVNATFDEVKLTTEGTSIAVLGMAGLFSSNVAPSQLILINMQTYEVEKSIIFNHGLSSGESVIGYASNSLGSYVVTNQFGEGTYNLTIYYLVSVSSIYGLTPIVRSSNPANSPILSELFTVGNLIFANILDELLIINEKGAVIDTIPNLSSTNFDTDEPNTTYSRVALVSAYESTDLYAQFTNNSIIKISVNGADYTSSIIATAPDMQFVVPNTTSNPLLFTLNYPNFVITDLVTSQIVYTTITSFSDIFITDTTYCLLQNKTLYIFASETNDLITELPFDLSYYDHKQYYDQEQYIVTFLNPTSNQTCQLTQLDLVTGELFVPLTLNSTCSIKLLQVVNNNHDITKLVYSNQGSYTILSPTFGLVEFIPPSNETSGITTLAVDYDSMTVYHFISFDGTNETSMFIYAYESTSKSFILQNSTTFNDFYVYRFSQVQDLVVSEGDPVNLMAVRTITIPSLSEVKYSFSMQTLSFSTLLDDSGNAYFITPNQIDFWAPSHAPEVGYSGQVQVLPGTNTYTLAAGGGGQCYYWTLDAMIMSFVSVRIYNVCSDNTGSTISA